MERREFLLAGTALGLPVITGCLSEDTTASNQRETNTPASQNPKQAREHLDNGARALEKAGEEIKAESQKFTDSSFQEGGVDIKTATINGYLDSANSEMDKAEEYATNEQQKRINAIRGYVAFAKEMVAFFDVFAEGYSQAYAAFTYFQSERYEDAVSELESSEATFSDTDDLLTVTQSRYEELDTSILDEIDAVQLTSLKSSLDDLDELVPAFQAMVIGMRQLAEGMIDYKRGVTQIENEQYASAESSFRSASEDFNSAHATFNAEEDGARPEIKSTFIEMTCYSGAIRDSSTHLANAMAAYQDGDSNRANEEIQAARDAGDRCEF